MTATDTNSLWLRLAKGGGPAAGATAVMMLVPLLGRAYLDDNMYAAWSLIASVGTVGLLIDMGAPGLTVRLAALGEINKRRIAVLVAVSAMPSLVVGGVAAAVWPIYDSHSELGQVPHMQAMLGVTAVAGALRSALVVQASWALGNEYFLTRAAILAGQALLSIGTVWALLSTGAGISSYPLSSLLSCSAVLLIVVLQRVLRVTVTGPRCARTHYKANQLTVSFRSELAAFASTRGLAAILGLGLTQLDRWIVGAVATSSFLADYDLAARFAILPKTALLTLGLSFVHESSRRDSARSLKRLLKTLYNTSACILVLGCGMSALLMAAYLWAFRITTSDTYWWLYVVLLLSACLNALTAPGTLILAGLGQPKYELYYLIPAFVAASLGATFFIVLESTWGVVCSLAAAVAVPSAFYTVWISKPIAKFDASSREQQHILAQGEVKNVPS